MQFLDSIRDVKKNYKIYDNWEQNQQDDVAKRQYLSQKYDLPKDKIDLTRAKAEAVFRASDMMDKRSEDNLANMEQVIGLASFALILPFSIASIFYQNKINEKNIIVARDNIKKQFLSSMGPLLLPLVPAIGLILWSNEKQKEASRIGRFQAKKYELKDTKNFVLHTPEQIQTALEIKKNIPVKKDKKNFLQSFSELKKMLKDKVEYDKWNNNRIQRDKDFKNILNTNFTSEQIAQGDEDREIIVNIVKDVNMSAEIYSEKVDNAFNTLSSMSFLTNIPIYWGVNKILKNSKNISPLKKQAIPVALCGLLDMGIIIWSAHEKKEASKVGRFKKRQEILDNPELIMSYSKDQLEQANEIKSDKVKKNFLNKLISNFTFIGSYLMDKKSYDHYKKVTLKDNERFYKALMQVDVTDEQMKEAKHIQDKTFIAFDKIDEMSQRYSEDVDTATQVVMQLITPVLSTLGMSIPFIAAISIKKGLVPFDKIIKTLSRIVLKDNSLLKKSTNQFYEVISKDKELRKDFSKIFIDNKGNNDLRNNPEINNIFKNLIENNKTGEKLENIIIPDDQFKQNFIAKWVKNLTRDIIKWNLNNYNNKNNVFEDLPGFFDQYKTLSKTILIGGLVPFFGITFVLPVLINSWFTNIKIKAGRIGIMKAMEEIDNPKLFVNHDIEYAKIDSGHKNIFEAFESSLSH